MDQPSDTSSFASRGRLNKPWLWLAVASFAVTLCANVFLEISAGEQFGNINFKTELLRAVLTGSVVTGLVWVLSVFRHRDESDGKPVLSLFLLGAGLALILFTLLFYTVENYRGKRAWLKCWQTSVARGEKLTLAELAPPAVPDDKNFAMDSIWVEAVTTQMGAEKAMTWYGDRVRAFGETNKARLFDLKAELPEVLWMTSNESGRWQLATTTDLTLWQDYYRRLAHRTNYFLIPSKPRSPAEDVLLALSRNNNIIEQLREASALPYARFPLDYASKNPGEILLPHLSMLKSVIFVLRLRTSAELQAGSSDSALDDIVLMMRFNDLIRDEPFLISQLIHIAMFQIEVQPIWEGLADQRWNDPQLAHLDAHLAQFDFLKSYTNVMAREKASVCQIVDYLERNRRDLKGAYEPLGPLLPLPRGFRENEALLNCFALAIPRGWFDQNKATVWRFYDEHVDRAIDLAHRTYSSSNAVQLSGAASRLGAAPSPYNRLANMLLPALTQAAKKFVFAQETLDFARLAIALERYRLANGRFPEKLDALSPKFLGQIPHDLITGKPLKYRRTEDGSFILYSVGWNATDDAGKVSQIPGGAPNPELGDWVWRYPQSKLQL